MADIAATPLTNIPEALTVSDSDAILIVQNGKGKRAKATLMKGAKGDTGSQGVKGDKGDKGDQGIQGVKGDKGDKGDQGIQGIKGDTGATGSQGQQGIQGLKGDKGDKGDKGEKGDKGDAYVASHDQLTGKDADDCHPISAITGLTDMLSKLTLWHGVEGDITVGNTALKRIGNMSDHVMLPIHETKLRCLLLDDGTVNYYLDANDSTLKEDGTPAILDGTDGMVMVETKEFWIRFETEGNKWRVKISQMPLPGFLHVPTYYRSAYEAAIDRTNPAAPKLASVVNTTPAFRGGNNNAAWDSEERSLLGMPGTNTSLTNFRAYARRRGTAGKNGAGWNCDLYDLQKWDFWLYIIEFANTNCQLPFNAQPTSEGFRQGGLGDGVTAMTATFWNSWNGLNPFVPCGRTNISGNKTGIRSFIQPGEIWIYVPTWHGIENPFGHIWSWADGAKCNIQANDAGGRSLFFVCNDPSKFQDVNYDSYEFRGILPRSNGYVKEVLFGKFGENMTKVAVGANTVTFFSDYFYTSLPNTGEAQRGVPLGGGAEPGAAAGLANALTNYAATYTNTAIGSRLCFLPE